MNLTKKQWAMAIGATAVILIAGVAFCSSANASEFYVKAEAGYAMDTEAGGFALGDDSTIGAYVGTGVGPLRVEAGVSRIEADTSIGITMEIDALYYNGTAYLDLPNGFFVGAGAGYMEAEAEFGPISFDDSGWAYHGAAGYAHRVNDSMIVEAQVRYIDADFDQVGDATSVQATLGLRLAL